jgi:hypothetical protein
MNARDDETPFSLPEFMAASIAMAAVAVIAFQGIYGPREVNLSARSLSRSRPAGTERSLQVSTWRLGDPGTKVPPRPDRPPDFSTVRKTETVGRGIRKSAIQPSMFFAEASQATAAEIALPEIVGPYPLIGPPDLFRMKNAIGAQPAKPGKETMISSRSERRESR